MTHSCLIILSLCCVFSVVGCAKPLPVSDASNAGAKVSCEQLTKVPKADTVSEHSAELGRLNAEAMSNLGATQMLNVYRNCSAAQ